MVQKICFVCGEKTSKDYDLCYDCYSTKEKMKKQEFYGDFAKEIRDNYFDFRDEIKSDNSTRVDKIDLLTFVSMADILFEKFGDSYLVDRVIEDIEGIRNSNKNIVDINRQVRLFNQQTDKISFDYRKKYPTDIRCDDGHYVRSKSEKIIDDWLYSHRIVHAYEKKVFFQEDPSENLYSDFFLPDGDVYIEFWGLNDKEDYLERKEHKKSLYYKSKKNLIELDERHVNILDDILPRELAKYISDFKF